MEVFKNQYHQTLQYHGCISANQCFCGCRSCWRQDYKMIPSTMWCTSAKQCFYGCRLYSGDKITRWSQTGMSVYMNKAPIFWYSKAQIIVESSMFGLEFVTLLAVEMGVTSQFGYQLTAHQTYYMIKSKKSVLTNATVPTYRLSKKHNAIASLFLPNFFGQQRIWNAIIINNATLDGAVPSEHRQWGAVSALVRVWPLRVS